VTGPALTADQLHRALDYPYGIPPTHFMFDGNLGEAQLLPDLAILRLSEVGTSEGATFYNVEISTSGETRTVHSVCPVVAAGSNAAPEQLKRKFFGKTQASILCPHCEVVGIVSAYTSHFTHYGAIAACLRPYAMARSRLFVTLMAEPELAIMHTTEGLGVEYEFRPLPAGVAAPSVFAAAKLFYYAPLHEPAVGDGDAPVLLSAFAVEGCPWPRADERTMLAAVLPALFPDVPIEAAIANIVGSDAVRDDATRRLKSIRVDLNATSAPGWSSS
jgi:hypothetical protein